MKIRKVTYCLQVSKFQYRYLLQEIKKSEIMYAYFCRQIDKAKDKEQILKKVREEIWNYQKCYMKAMIDSEVESMLSYLTSYAKTKSTTFLCEQGVVNYRWRNISLYPMIKANYYWQKEPLIFHWEIRYSACIHRHHRLYLVLGFLEEGL